jgi:hypothetical protein
MATLQIQSTLIEDVYPHQAVSSDGDIAVTEDSNGLLTIFSIGTNGHVYRIAPDAASNTGWRVDDLQCPEPLNVIAAIMDSNRNLVVCGGNQQSACMYSIVISADGQPGAWNRLQPGPDVTGTLTFYDVQLRTNASGAVEFLLLYFQRMNDPQWHYTYRIGRALTSASSWSIGFNLDNLLYTGPQPSNIPSMTLGLAGDAPTLFLYWFEAERIRAWQGLDGAPTASDISVPGGSVIRSLLALGPGPDSTLYAAGSIGSVTAPGLYRYSTQPSGFVLLSGSSAIQSARAVYSDETGYDVLCVGPGGELFHLHGDPTATTWAPFSPMGDRVVGVAGCLTEAAGPVFIAGTLDKTLRHYYRASESVDWEVEEIDVPARTAEQVVWYTTKASVLDANARAINSLDVVISCTETTEVLVNGRPELVGPGRPIIVPTSVVGNLMIQQSTAELSNLYVPQLRLDLLTGESGTLEAYSDVRSQLYALTGDELKAAEGRNGQPVLPANQAENADEIALQIATGASLGLAPPPGAKMVSWESLGSPASGKVVFTPSGGGPAISLDIDIGDLFESIKESFFGAFTALVTAVGDTIVTGLNLVITVAEGAYTVFLDTMEHAFDAIRSVFESIGSVFQTVLEWLGKLFDWEAIKATAAQVASMLRQGMNGIPQILTMAGLPGQIAPIFDNLRQQATTAIDYIRSQIGGSSLGTGAQSAGFTNSDSVFTFNGKSYSNQANWLLDRLTPQLGGTLAVFSLDNPGWDGFGTVWSSVTDSFLQTGEAVANNFIQLFQNLVTTTDVLGTAINGVLDQFETIITGILNALQSLATGVVSALQTLASSTALADLFDTPITFPVVSDILAAVGLGSVTILDILSYLVAIPMHVVNTIFGLPTPTDQVASTPDAVYLALGILFLQIGVFTSIQDALPEGKKVLAVLPSITWIAACFLVGAGVLTAAEPPPELIIAAVFYLVYQGLGLYLNIRWFGEVSAVRGFAIYSIVDAVVMNVLAAVWAIRTSQDPDPNNRPKPWQIVANHVGTLPDIFRWSDLVWPPPNPKPVPVRVMMVGVDIIGMGALTAGAITDFVNVLHPIPASDAATA